MHQYNQIEEFFQKFSEIREIYSEEVTDKTYIYAIFDSDKNLIYIGKSENVVNRFKEHKKNIPAAHLCRYAQVLKEEVSDIEFVLVSKFLPKENKSLPPRNSYLNLDEYQSFDQRFYSHRICVLRLLKFYNISCIHGYYHKTDLALVSSKLTEEVGS